MIEVTDGLARDTAYVDNFLDADEPETSLPAETAFAGPDTMEDVVTGFPDIAQNERGIKVTLDRSRDANLTEFGKATLRDRYLLPDEDFQDLFARVAMHFADGTAHAQRLYDYISKLWFMPSTPVLSNGGTKRGLPISCFLNEANDSLGGILGLWNENVWLAARGGGIGSYWGNLRSIGEKVGLNGKTSGVVPFIRVMDSLTLAISQGSLRRGSAAVYLPVSHPEIEEFIELRRPTGGDPNRKTPNLHHGVLIPDAFMRAVEADEEWALTSPKDDAVLRKVKARDLWIRILTARIETGEPYIINIDHVNRNIPEHQKLGGLTVKTSNLCSEITLPTGIDRFDKQRTAVCCLSSLNLEKYHEWEDNPQIIEDVMRFLDNALQDFIDQAPEEFKNATYAAMRERSVGLGVMASTPSCRTTASRWKASCPRSGTSGCSNISARAPTRRRRSSPRNAAPAPMPPISALRNASPTSSRWHQPPRFRSSAAAPRRASSRLPPTASRTRRCRAPSPCATHR